MQKIICICPLHAQNWTKETNDRWILNIIKNKSGLKLDDIISYDTKLASVIVSENKSLKESSFVENIGRLSLAKRREYCSSKFLSNNQYHPFRQRKEKYD